MLQKFPVKEEVEDDEQQEERKNREGEENSEDFTHLLSSYWPYIKRKEKSK